MLPAYNKMTTCLGVWPSFQVAAFGHKTFHHTTQFCWSVTAVEQQYARCYVEYCRCRDLQFDADAAATWTVVSRHNHDRVKVNGAISNN